ncbi:serine peptidase [Leucothrix pacifica]|uniref:Probable periplasmic serine endoprotease DegP-like n=2 Tax=Leucothrix pacifica TaxID=1247513 RepID=A0A317CH75_9GAMM|nr:serine peptidase [Leucothrix pacifica]
MRAFSLTTLALLLIPVSFVCAKEFPDFTALVKKQSASVVNISTERQLPNRSKLPPGIEIPEEGTGNEALDEFLRRFFDYGQDDDEDGNDSLGSGFIVSADGYVVTNHHVVDGADQIKVNLNDRRELDAEVIGSDKRSDLALLKIEGEDLPAVTFGSSDKLEVGEWVIAIGSPFGFDHSVTAGIVSAKDRNLPSEGYVPFIQTDVAINPGNSGGPLFNLEGEVVGINSQIYSRTGGFMGLSFSIPVDVARNVIEQLKTTGEVRRGWLGVYIQEVSRQLAPTFGLDHATGALVAQVMPGGPADGILKAGDVILEFAGKTVESSATLPFHVGSARLDEKVDILVKRNGSNLLVSLQLGELENQIDDEEPEEREAEPEPTSDIVLGMAVEDIDDDIRDAVGVDKGGILVQRVLGDSAMAADVQRGDIITQFDGKLVEDVSTFQKLSKQIASDKTLAILVIRDGAARFLAFKPDADTEK